MPLDDSLEFGFLEVFVLGHHLSSCVCFESSFYIYTYLFRFKDILWSIAFLIDLGLHIVHSFVLCMLAVVFPSV